MTLELSDFLKLPVHKPNNYYISSECNYILEHVSNIEYLIYICPLLDHEFIVIYMNNDGKVIFNIITTNNGVRLCRWSEYILNDNIHSPSFIRLIDGNCSNTSIVSQIKYNINSISDIDSDIADISKCLSDVGIIDVLSNIISSYLLFTLYMYNCHSTRRADWLD